MSVDQNMFESDFLLWQAFRAGRQEAFEAIYQKYVRTLYNYGYNLTRNAAVVEDAIQDLFVYLHEHRSTLGQTDNIKYYLLRSLRRLLAKNATRKEQSGSEEYLFADAIFVSDDNPFSFIEQEAQALQHRQVMQRAMHRLGGRSCSG